MSNRAVEELEQWATVMGDQQINDFALLLKAGTPGVVTDLTPEEAEAVAELHERIQPEIRKCYQNAQRALLRCDVDCDSTHDVRYWEGYYSRYDLPAFAHAWLTINGKVVDLTHPNEKIDYFGVEIDWELVREYMLETETHGPLLQDFALGFKYTRAILAPDSAGAGC